MKALVIEDDKNLARLLREWLEACGYTVHITGSLGEAEAHIAAAPEVKLVTLDLNLTDSTREQTIPRIRSIRNAAPHALLVVISGVITHQDERSVLALGADAMIEKHEIPTERTFMRRLRDVFQSLFKNHEPARQERLAELESMATRVITRCNALGCTVGQSLINEPPATDPTSEQKTNP